MHTHLYKWLCYLYHMEPGAYFAKFPVCVTGSCRCRQLVTNPFSRPAAELRCCCMHYADATMYINCSVLCIFNITAIALGELLNLFCATPQAPCLQNCWQSHQGAAPKDRAVSCNFVASVKDGYIITSESRRERAGVVPSRTAMVSSAPI